MNCPRCRFESPAGFRFCGGCGSSLSGASEPLPGMPPPDDALTHRGRLPPEHTAKALSQRGRIEGEKRSVTVMFCDLEGYTALAEALDPEELYRLMDEVYEVLIHGVHDLGGSVNELTGDGVVALFGAPIALEDGPQRAIRASLAIHRELAKLSDRVRREHSTLSPLRIRIGIHTGPVVVGPLGNDLRVEFKAVGDTVNLAARMEELAEPGTTYITEETYRLTQGLFRCEALGEKRTKGKSTPVTVYRIIAPSGLRTRFDASAERGLTPFVGRGWELELLLEAFDRTKAGVGQAFSIVGEAGMGKSRLLYEFRKSVSSEDVTFLEGDCLSYSRNLAYHPVIEILKAALDVRGEDKEPEIREKVTRAIQALGLHTEALPYLLELLSVPESGIDEIALSPERKKERMLEALKELVSRSAQTRPLILAVENLHWIDRSSEDALKLLLESLPGRAIFLVLTYRPEYLPLWDNRSYHRQVTLDRLAPQDCKALLAHLLGASEIEPAIEELVLAKAEGVPFFLEEFVKSLQDLRAIEKRGQAYSLAKGARTASLPASIEDVILARIDALPEGAKTLLQTGSVIGREFGHELIQKVTDLPDPELRVRLLVLRNAELLYERGAPPDTSYAFKHALIQDVAYRSLLTGTRRELHRTTAGVLEERFQGIAEARPELLAHHFTMGGLQDPAISYWHKAGLVADRRAAHAEAVAHLSEGLQLLQTGPESPDRDCRELQLRLALGGPVIVTKGFAADAVEDNYLRAKTLCQRAGDDRQLFRVLVGLHAFHLVRAQYDKSLELAEEFLDLARRAPDEAFFAFAAQWAFGFNFMMLGEPAAAQRHVRQALLLSDSALHSEFARSSGGMYLKAHCLLEDSLLLDWLGYPRQAVARCEEAVSFAEGLSDPFAMATAGFFGAWLHYSRRDLPATLRLANLGATVATQHGFPYWRAQSLMLSAWALSQQGQLPNADSEIRRALNALQRTGARQTLPRAHALLGEACWKAGRILEGLQALDDGLALVDRTNERFFETELHRLRGEMLQTLSPSHAEAAQDCFLRAIELAQRKDAKSLELKASMSLARLWHDQGKREPAREMLGAIYRWFTEGFETPYLQEAKALLEELGG